MQCHTKQPALSYCKYFVNRKRELRISIGRVNARDPACFFGHPDTIVIAPNYFPRQLQSFFYYTGQLRKRAVYCCIFLFAKRNRQQKQ
jgi:hypothetical protein